MHSFKELETLFRESEAQTDPYSPEYVLKEGELEEPEVWRLANLKWSECCVEERHNTVSFIMVALEHGLPVGLDEIEMIESIRT